MTPSRKPQRKPVRKAKPQAKRAPIAKTKAAAKTKTAKTKAAEAAFPAAFAMLLKRKKLAVPKGLLEAPPEAYASQPASLVEQLEGLPNAQLREFADKVAGYTVRRRERARAEWERSPLIAELRRRKLKEPPPPHRPVGISVSLTKPVEQWTDKELVRAAEKWSQLGRS